MRLFSLLTATLVLSASTLIAHADSIYTYTGKDFTSADGPFTTNDFVSGSLTTTTPLADNLDKASITPASFSFNDGVNTITNTNEFEEGILISTNASGAITDWSIIIGADNGAEVILIAGGPQFAGGDGDMGANRAGSGINSVSGVFTSAAPIGVTPEPSTLALLGTGILGLAGMARRKVLPQS
jgi:hypothetical protein